MSQFTDGHGIDSETLEGLIDTHGLANVLEALVAICYEKASHLQTNWQDDGAAREWTKAGRRIATAEVAVHKISLP